MHEGDELQLADCAEISSKRYGDPLPRHLREYLHDWSSAAVSKRWEEYTAAHQEGGPWLDAADVTSVARYMKDYLTTENVFEEMCKRLGPLVNLKTKDEAARRRARRKYVRILMNDFLMNPGPSMAPIAAPETPGVSREEAEKDQPQADYGAFGLMGGFVKRWVQRLPQALASGAGEHVQVPPGNSQLISILDPFDK
jgi:hypothetical protein